jgi:hypothetical protein
MLRGRDNHRFGARRSELHRCDVAFASKCSRRDEPQLHQQEKRIVELVELGDAVTLEAHERRPLSLDRSTAARMAGAPPSGCSSSGAVRTASGVCSACQVSQSRAFVAARRCSMRATRSETNGTGAEGEESGVHEGWIAGVFTLASFCCGGIRSHARRRHRRGQSAPARLAPRAGPRGRAPGCEFDRKKRSAL